MNNIEKPTMNEVHLEMKRSGDWSGCGNPVYTENYGTKFNHAVKRLVMRRSAKVAQQNQPEIEI